MPAGNRTGPNGEGPMTGRRLGYCPGYDSPGYMQYGRGYRGRGYGYGRVYCGRGGYGRGRFNYPHSYPQPQFVTLPPSIEERNPEKILKDLEYHKSRLENELQMIDKAIDNQKEPKSTE